MTLHEILRRVTTSRYTRALEAGVTRRDAELARERAEVRRLRAENRALLNSILGIAGIPPVIAGGEEWEEAAMGPQLVRPPADARASEAAQSVLPAQGSARESAMKQRAKGAHPAAPLRRRSWQQINRALEIEAARRKQPVDADA